MNWKGRKVLVTGAGGFIGSHLCERLVRVGADVVALVRYNSRGEHGLLDDLPSEMKRAIDVVLGDIRDESTFGLHLKKMNLVFHLAAIPGIPYSFIHPRDVFDTNTSGSLNLLNAARSCELDNIILVSSAETYGDARYTPINEQHPQLPKSPYAASKAAMEKYGWSFYYSYRLPITIVRLFNNFGPRQSARAVTPTIITQLLERNALSIGSLHPRRDFTLVLDTVDALLRIAEHQEKGEVFNIGSGTSVSVKEIIETVCKIMGKKDTKVMCDKTRVRPGNSEVEALIADCSHLNELTGWEPKYSYEDGLRLTIDWIKEHRGQYKSDIYNI